MGDASLYAFTTTWEFTSPPERVWEVLIHPDLWPAHWDGLVHVSLPLAPAGPEVRTWHWRAPLGYALKHRTVTTELVLHQVVATSVDGDLEGTGRWELEARGGGSRLTFYWNVSTQNAWMRWLAPWGGRKLFSVNHDRLMAQGFVAFKRMLREG